MQNAGISELGLNWRYLAFDVDPAHLGEAIAGARRMNFIGLNLTVPHKLLALKIVDVLDDSAAAWGAVNTIRFEGRTGDGQWLRLGEMDPAAVEEIRSHGFNTDADALVQAITEDLQLKLHGASVVLLGAGGAGRVAALKLASENVSELYLINRTRSTAATLADEIAQRYPAVWVGTGYPPKPVDLLVNATSVGLDPADDLPFDRKQFQLSSTRFVYDMIYRPAETPLLKAAREAGCRIANGLGMLLYQGVRALEIWSGRPAPVEAMRLALIKEVYGH